VVAAVWPLQPTLSWCVSSMTTNDDQCRRSSFGCHVAAGDVTPVSDVKKRTGGGDVSAHLAFHVNRRGEGE